MTLRTDFFKIPSPTHTDAIQANVRSTLRAYMLELKALKSIGAPTENKGTSDEIYFDHIDSCKNFSEYKTAIAQYLFPNFDICSYKMMSLPVTLALSTLLKGPTDYARIKLNCLAKIEEINAIKKQLDAKQQDDVELSPSDKRMQKVKNLHGTERALLEAMLSYINHFFAVELSHDNKEVADRSLTLS